MSDGILDEAYVRLQHAGPEWGEDRLTNHGPMAVEVLVRRGYSDEVHGWLDAYLRRLDDLPRPSDVITDDTWRLALGDGSRVADWTAYLERQVQERPWRGVLETWWPRLLPGIAAGATHGVIRTSHAVRTLLRDGEDPAAVTELAHAIAFWAARSLTVPGAVDPQGRLDPADALAVIPRIPAQEGTVANRFGQLTGMSAWGDALAALRAPADPEDARRGLADLVDAATVHYLAHGQASPVLLVHPATAPNAVLHTLPALPPELWAPSLSAVWAACAAITAAYSPARPLPRSDLPAPVDSAEPTAEVLDRAAHHGDEHVIKFSDTAAEVYERSGDPDALAAAVQIGELIESPRTSS